MVREDRNHNQLKTARRSSGISPSAPVPAGILSQKELRQGILRAVIAVSILVILSIIAVGGCRANAPEPQAITEKPLTFEFERQNREAPRE